LAHSDAASSANSTSAAAPSEEELLAHLSQAHPQLAVKLMRCGRDDGDQAVAAVRRRRAFVAKQKLSRVAALACRSRRVDADIAAATATTVLRNARHDARLERQWGGMDRRLQELFFECLGEFAKASGRASRRSGFLSRAVDRHVADSLVSSQWALFCCRLEEDLQGAASLEDVDPRKRPGHFGGLARLCQPLLSPLLPPEAVGRVARVVELRPSSGRVPRRQRSEATNAVSGLVPSTGVVALLVSAARGHKDNAVAASAPSRPLPPGTAARPNFHPDLLLSSRPATWLMLPTWLAAMRGCTAGDMSDRDERLVNSWVYFSVEERAAQLPQSDGPRIRLADYVTDHVSRLYGGVLARDVPAPGPNEVTAVVTGVSSAHRSLGSAADGPLRDFAASYPDVLQARAGAGAQHFACCTVGQLAESVEFASIRSKKTVVSQPCIEPSRVHFLWHYCFGLASFTRPCFLCVACAQPGPALSHLYVLVTRAGAVSSGNVAVGARLVPLPPAALRELIAAYLSREAAAPDGLGKATALATAEHILPSPARTDGVEAAYCVVHNPAASLWSARSESDGAPQCPPTALLVEVMLSAQGDASAEPEAEELGRGKWDEAIMWGFCRWRSCLARATAHPSPRYLCAAHSHLKEWLDGRAGKASESSRFLPKRTAGNAARSPEPTLEDDLLAIRSASSLLIELGNGKLASTIQSFCQRAAAESSDRHMLAQANREPPPPPWARWSGHGSGHDLAAALGAIECDRLEAEAALAAERAATGELAALEELGVFPTAEVALLRRDRASDGLPDAEACQRKLSLLRLRRQAAEHQVAAGGAGV